MKVGESGSSVVLVRGGWGGGQCPPAVLLYSPPPLQVGALHERVVWTWLRAYH